MSALFPFRDINVHASNSYYAFSSPSSSSAQTLVVERPSGDLRLNDGVVSGAKRVSSIAGILGIIKLGLGNELRQRTRDVLMLHRQVCDHNHQSSAHGKIKGAYGV